MGNLLTVAEVAARLRLSQATIREWLRLGRLPGLKMGEKRTGWRIDEDDVKRFLEQSKQKAS